MGGSDSSDGPIGGGAAPGRRAFISQPLPAHHFQVGAVDAGGSEPPRERPSDTQRPIFSAIDNFACSHARRAPGAGGLMPPWAPRPSPAPSYPHSALSRTRIPVDQCFTTHRTQPTQHQHPQHATIIGLRLFGRPPDDALSLVGIHTDASLAAISSDGIMSRKRPAAAPTPRARRTHSHPPLRRPTALVLTSNRRTTYLTPKTHPKRPPPTPITQRDAEAPARAPAGEPGPSTAVLHPAHSAPPRAIARANLDAYAPGHRFP